MRTLILVTSLLCISVLSTLSAAAASATDFSTSRGFPALRDLTGKTLADGDYSQWREKGRLHVRLVYRFGDGRRQEEHAVFREAPQLTQDEWSWRETHGTTIDRAFAVDFRSGVATAEKRVGTDVKRWEEKLNVTPGRAFVGFGVSLAIADARTRLVKGEVMTLQSVGFTPKPRAVSVEISHGGIDSLRMSGRTLKGDRFVVHPRIPWYAKFFVKVPDVQIWLTNPPPATFLRFEGPVGEPDDPVARVDLLPGGRSEAARPVGTSGR